MRGLLLSFLAVGFVCVPQVGRAVLFYSTGDPGYNTNAPSGTLEGSGWQFQGKFQVTASDGYLGTPIAPHHFITADHLPSANVGDVFFYDGMEYTTIGKASDAPTSDLALWEVDGTFASYAPVYSGAAEAGKDCVVFGRGTQRGAAVVANGGVKGWMWGARDYVVRWGENRVDGATTVNGKPVLQADFDSDGGANECMLSDKDSGGGLFINDGGIWKLAGIHYTVHPSTFSFSPSGSNSFKAALFDYSFRPSDSEKIYYYNDAWQYCNSLGNDPCRFFSSRISSRYSWITNNIPDFDRDVDGLPDWWETQHCGDATSMERDGHLDGDGFSNHEEWIADTDPANGSSFFHLEGYTNAAEVAFASSTNRKYQIQYRTDLAGATEVWQTEVDWFVGAYSQTVESVSAATGSRFYRVRAKLP